MPNSFQAPYGTKERIYTPLIVGFGTSSGVNSTTYNFFFSRVQNRLNVMGRFTAGVATAVEARLYFPPTSSGSTAYLGSDTGLITSNITHCKGSWANAAAAYAGSNYVLIEPSVNYVTFGQMSATANPLTKLNGNVIASNGQVISVAFEVPISGWNY